MRSRAIPTQPLGHARGSASIPSTPCSSPSPRNSERDNSNMRRPFPILLFALLAVVLVAGQANALTYRQLTDTEMKAAIKRLLKEATSAGTGDDEELKRKLDIAVVVAPIVEMGDAACPIPLK